MCLDSRMLHSCCCHDQVSSFWFFVAALFRQVAPPAERLGKYLFP
jgi:hypothetical protein